MKKLLTFAAVMASTPAFAIDDPLTATPVPEISALEGTAAIAVVVALVLLAWERRRRAV